MYVLEAKGVTRQFFLGNQKNTILNSVDLQIESGTFNVLMGPSGSGKTTLLNILGVLDRPDKGEVRINGNEVSGLSDYKRDALRRKELGYVFQSVALISNMTAFQNIDFSLRICGYSSKERRSRVEECLEFVDLQKRMKHYPGEMSGGEQQRVAIARAIAHRPKILLADEPTAELDTATGLRIVKLFKELVVSEGIAVLMCTHDSGMLEIADKIFVMEDGVILHGNE